MKCPPAAMEEPGSREEQREARPRPRVCRRLFAEDLDMQDPAYHSHRDNLHNQLKEQINRDLDEACKKYNFDFRNEEPLQGNWVWERMGQGEVEPPQQRVVTPDPPAESPPPQHSTPQRPQQQQQQQTEAPDL